MSTALPRFKFCIQERNSSVLNASEIGQKVQPGIFSAKLLGLELGLGLGQKI